jgi:hypothetical protein
MAPGEPRGDEGHRTLRTVLEMSEVRSPRVRKVAELRSKGIAFEEYDLPGMKSWIMSHAGGKTAWFKDTEGNILALIQGAQSPRFVARLAALPPVRALAPPSTLRRRSRRGLHAGTASG